MKRTAEQANLTAYQRMEYELALGEAHYMLNPSSSLRLPWEEGVFAEIFGSSRTTKPSEAIAPYPLPVEDVARPGLKEAEAYALSSEPLSEFGAPEYKSCLKHCRMEAGGRDGADSESVLRRWLWRNPSGSELGKMLLIEGADGVSLLSESFAGKSTSTLLKRVRYSARVVAWAIDNGHTLFPLDLQLVLDFMRSQEKQSSKSECGETLNFLIHVVGVLQRSDLMSNPVVAGILRGSRIREEDAKQSRVLTVAEVKALEDILMDAFVDPVGRYGAGVFLFQIFSRARVSDIRNILRFDADILDGDGYLEIKTLDHKTAKRGANLGQCLLLVAPVHGLGNSAWGLDFLKIANEVGMSLEKGRRGPLLPRLTDSGKWGSKAVDSTETTMSNYVA